VSEVEQSTWEQVRMNSKYACQHPPTHFEQKPHRLSNQKNTQTHKGENKSDRKKEKGKRKKKTRPQHNMTHTNRLTSMRWSELTANGCDRTVLVSLPNNPTTTIAAQQTPSKPRTTCRCCEERRKKMCDLCTLSA